MTRRKQNYPKRLKCSPSEDNAGQGPGESGADNSPLATDEEEEEDEEEEPTGDDDTPATSLPDVIDDNSDDVAAAAAAVAPANDSLEDDAAASRPADPAENPPSKSLLESHSVVSPTQSASTPPSHTPSPPPPSSLPPPLPPPPAPTSALNALASLSRMTVLANLDDARITESAASEEDLGQLPSAAKAVKKPNSAPKPNHDDSITNSTSSTSNSSSSSRHSPSSRMASIIVPMPSLSRSLLPSPEKEASKRVSPAAGRHQRGHSDFYERMAAQALASATLTSTVVTEEAEEEQPLDLSRKSSRPRSISEPEPPPASRRERKAAEGRGKEGGGGGGGGLSNGISSLQSLQKRFGGDFLLESPRRPSSIIPLQSTILPSKSLLRPPPIVHGNGLSHLGVTAAAAAAAAAVSPSHHHHHQQQQPHHHHQHHHHQQGAKAKATGSGGKGDRLDKLLSLATSSNCTTTTSSKKADKSPEVSEASRKSSTSTTAAAAAAAATTAAADSSKSGKSGGGSSGGGGGRKEEAESKYTIHRCSCQKSFGTLYSLSAHLQETGHMPGSSKQASLMDYPKLVRGQDMWLNQESEQTRRILRCMQCGESFKSLPMLTVHMMQTQHYSKIVSAEHGRRSHKCSAYCDRELDKECIFKCKVCQETYTDMEGLANHMIVSGHHKKQVLRSHNYSELGLRHKHRKRFLSDDASGSTVASLLEYKRKYQGGGGGGSNGYLPQVGCSAAAVAGAPAAAASDGLITCEACGKRMEMQWFVEHVRLCLRQKAEVIDALKVKLSAEDGGGGSGKAPESSSSSSSSSSARSDSRRLSPNAPEQPLPSTKDSALFKRLNSLSGGASPGKEPDRSSAAHKDSDSTEEKEEKSEETETDVNRNESQDVAKIQTQDGDIIPSVKSADNDSQSARSPETLSREADETRSAPKKDADSSPGETVQGELPEKSDEPCAKVREQSAAPSGVAEGKEAEREKDASVPSQQIPSPMTDEDNTSEHERSPSPSPQSGLSQSGDSKPPSPSATSPPSSPPSKRTSPKILDSTKPSVKREHDSDGGGADSDARNHKKMKLEESRLQHQEEAEDVEVVRKKIKVELPDDSDDGLKNRTPPPPPAATAASPSTAGEKSGQSGSKSTSSQLDKSLDIIDPNSGEEPAKESGSSALKAMESFIQRSFSSKFDSRRSSMSAGFGAFGNAAHLPPILGMSRVAPRSCASPPTSSSSSAASSISYLSRFSKFFAPMQPSSSKYLDIAMDAPLPSFEKNVLSSLSARSAELLEKSRNSGRDYSGSKQVTSNGVAAKQVREAVNKSKPATTTTTSSKSPEDGKTRETEDENDDKKTGDKDSEAEKGCGEEEDDERELANKYLNLDEEDEKDEKAGDGDGEEGASAKPGTSSSSGKRSALDSLSSFVYGQPMTSEHPLDSLQKLLTKTSIPKMMTSAAGAFPHFNPHHYPYLTEQMMERLCCSPPDLPSSSSAAAAAATSAPAMPLNLSMKPGAGGSEDEDPGDCHPDCESPSTSRELEDGNHSSPGAPGPDGELTEYKCAACSRRFASKGSYRYHLSRCHLSSVKKYGIKEAFNMSPYIYLPLDHTAKFTKYYQMAQELASKGK